MADDRKERLQKVLAHAGVASRRASEALILQGRVTVNGKVVTELGVKVDPRRDEIAVDGQKISSQAEKPVYIMLNKPRNVVSTVSDRRGRKTVLDLVDAPERVYPVGRLDAPSEGLILLTNDGDLAYHLTHPRYHIEKEYHVLVAGRPGTDTLARWSKGGIEVEGKPAAPAQVERLRVEGPNAWLRIVMTEGRKRQIRVIAKKLGHPVIRLERVRLGPLRLGNLKPGRWRYLTPAEVQRLKAEVKRS
ncbi:MAG: rRNA pseudouridine synthase [Chloroflexi bacterium]|nr:MAG: rRNA pseudouridine synthase [Chloroflexota bacterium]